MATTAVNSQVDEPRAAPTLMAAVARAVASYSAHALLRDGTPVHIRAIQPDDTQRLAHHFRRLGTESVRNRFFGAKKELGEAELHYFTELDFRHHVGLALVRRVKGQEEFLGVARYIQLADGVQAELGMAVADAFQRLGAGTLLLEHLARAAAANGIVELVAFVLSVNHRAIDMLKRSGFVLRQAAPDDTSLCYVLSTALAA